MSVTSPYTKGRPGTESSSGIEKTGPLRKPWWLKQRFQSGATYWKVDRVLKDTRLHTVCQEARCPNLTECFSRGTATFLILGDRCTRNCRFCAVAHGRPGRPDREEPNRVAEAVYKMGLSFVVITSVTRDDLSDGGAGQFCQTIRQIRRRVPSVRIEVLVPDFRGSECALKAVVRALPDVFNHNVETVPRLYSEVRPGADYHRSLLLLKRVRELVPDMPTKSGLMLGLGETPEEIRQVFGGLLEAGCRMLTLGQYLQPSKNHLYVRRFVSPEEFGQWREVALHMGFRSVASGPLVRSSYQADKLYRASSA